MLRKTCALFISLDCFFFTSNESNWKIENNENVQHVLLNAYIFICVGWRCSNMFIFCFDLFLLDFVSRDGTSIFGCFGHNTPNGWFSGLVLDFPREIVAKRIFPRILIGQTEKNVVFLKSILGIFQHNNTRNTQQTRIRD